MTEKKNPDSLADLFQDESFDEEVLKAKTEKIGYKFVPASMKLKTQLDQAARKNDPAIAELETREMSITMPKVAWEGVDLIAEIFLTAEEHIDVNDENDDSPHARLLRSLRKNMETTGGDLEEVLVAQAALDNIVSFMNTMAQTALLNRLQADLSNPEKLNEILQTIDDELREVEESVRGTSQDEEDND